MTYNVVYLQIIYNNICEPVFARGKWLWPAIHLKKNNVFVGDTSFM